MAAQTVARDFEVRIASRSMDPLFSAQSYMELSKYLSKSSGPKHDIRILERHPFVREIILRSSHPFEHQVFVKLSKFQEEHFTIDSEHKKSEPKATNKLVILTGKSAPEWLNAVAAAYSLDPEFYLSHSMLRGAIQEEEFFANPTLPSDPTRSTVIQLVITTIGFLRPYDRNVPAGSLAKARSYYSKALKQLHKEGLAQNSFATPVIRKIHIHDKEHFSIDQEVNITVVREGGHWTVIAWFDCGDQQNPFERPLLDNQDGSFIDKNTWVEWCPTVLNRQDVEANLEAYQDQDNPNGSKRLLSTQTLANLPASYGHTLRAEAAAVDPFYALREIYDFQLAAELQFANMMEQIIKEQMEGLLLSSDDRATTASDFESNRGVLESHLDRISDVIASIEKGVPLPLQDECAMDLEVASITENLRKRLIADYKYLQQRLDRLTLRCQHGINLVMANASLLEVRWANEQSNGLAKLTKLGTWITLLYVPMSYITSIFGMNVSQFHQGPVSMWVWAAVSGPVLVFALLLFGIRAMRAWLAAHR